VSYVYVSEISKQITVLSLGDDVAKGLGQNIVWIKAAAIGIVILLAGSSVSAAGPIGFIGLVVPHIVRFLVGTDYR
jgi:iron complex transport system permease protein